MRRRLAELLRKLRKQVRADAAGQPYVGCLSNDEIRRLPARKKG